MKKLINDPADVVKEALLGVEAAHSDRVRVDHENKIIYRKDAPRQGKVGLISGGGSGHWMPPAPVRCSPRRYPTR
jgi:phosphoenolpyruvate---glycerone phosphotransferase subunit DhaK